MKRNIIKQLGLAAGTVVVTCSLAALPAAAVAETGTPSTPASAANQTRLQLIITRGNNEIVRRLTTLNTLSSKISSAPKLTASDQSSLSSEVTTEISGLTSLKAKLDADTTVTTA